MARVVCQVLVRADRLTFLWSEGPRAFEPYHKSGAALHEFRQLTRDVSNRLRSLAEVRTDDRQAVADAGIALAHAGHDLYQQLFRADDAQADLAQEVRSWLTSLDRAGALHRLDVVSDTEDDGLPWPAVHDSPPDETSLRAAADTPEGWRGFWGARLELSTGRRVSPLRSRFLYEQPATVLAIDTAAREALSAEGWEQLRAAAQAGSMTVVEGAGALLDALRAGQPDLLYLFCRVSGHGLLFGDERLTAGELRDALGANTSLPGTRSDTLVVLNACRAAGGEADADVLDLARALETRAFLAPRVPLAPEPANQFGVEFLTGFLTRGERLGQVLARLCGRTTAPLGLLYSACAPAELRVVLGEAGSTAIQAEGGSAGADKALDSPVGPEPLPLPETPYFPLVPYDAGDRGLFVGREDDMEAFTEALDEPGLRLLVLHGAIGVGKASLLRAGVVPFLEEECVGYRALRDRSEPLEPVEGRESSEDDQPVAMLRATSDLAGQLAIALCNYCARPYVYRTPTGRTVEVDLSGILRGAVLGGSPATTAIKAEGAAGGGPPPLPPGPAEPEAVRTALRRDPRLLGTLLAELAEHLPHELVVLVEQGDEVFTLAGRSQEGATPIRELKMLRRLAETPGRARVVLSLRTEYQGRLLNQLQQGAEDITWLRSYLLEPLGEKALVQAILGPTSVETPPAATEAPFTKYRFLYEEGLAEHIARTARRAAAERHQSGTALVQVVCARLAALVRGRKDNNIVQRADLARIGGIEEGLVRDFEVRFAALPLGGRERTRLRQILDGLVFHPAEGLPVRDLVPEEKLATDWKGPTALSAVLEAAADAHLVELNWLDVGGKEGRYVSLGHDVLAPVLERETEERTRRVQNRARIADTLWIMVPLVILALVWGWTRMRATGAVEAEVTKLDDNNKKLTEELKRLRGETMVARWPVYAGFISRAQDALRAGNLLGARQQLLGVLPQGQEAQKDPGLFQHSFEWYYLWHQLDRSRKSLGGHMAPVGTVEVAPDGKALASADEVGIIKLWDAGSGQIRATLKGHNGAVRALAFAPKGAVLASAGADGSVRLWDANAGAKGDYVHDAKALATLKGHKGSVQALAFAPDGKTLASGGADGAVKLWSVTAKGEGKEGAVVVQWKGAVNALAWAPDGKTLAASGSDDALIQLWDVDKVGEGGKAVEGKALKGHGGPVRALAFAPDSKVLASGAVEKQDGFAGISVWLWDVAAGKRLGTVEAPPLDVFGLAFTPDGKTLAIAGKDDAARLYDAETGKLVRTLRGHLGWVRAVAFTPDGKTLVTGSQDTTVKLWNTSAGADGDVLRGHTGSVNAVAFSPDDTKLASGGADGLVRLWDVAAGKGEKTLKGHKGAVLALAYSPDGKLLASAGADGTIWLWDMAAKDEKLGTKVEVLKGHKGAVTSLGFFVNSKLLASGGEDGSARVWDTDLIDKSAFGKPFATKDVRVPVRAVVLLTDQKGKGYLAAGADSGKIFLWALGDPEGAGIVLEGHTAAVQALAFWEASGSYLASGGADRTVQVWDLSKGVNLRTLRGHVNTVGSLAFAKTGALLVSGGWDGVVRLWNAGLLVERFALVADQGPVQAVAVTADQRTLASAGRDGTVRLWRGTPRKR
jgi:WD40 repeat protein